MKQVFLTSDFEKPLILPHARLFCCWQPLLFYQIGSNNAGKVPGRITLELALLMSGTS